RRLETIKRGEVGTPAQWRSLHGGDRARWRNGRERRTVPRKEGNRGPGRARPRRIERAPAQEVGQRGEDVRDDRPRGSPVTDVEQYRRKARGQTRVCRVEVDPDLDVV